MKLKDCPICNNSATTKEHIIPQWLQRVFSLENKKLALSNLNTIEYKQAIIQLCQNCNGNIFSPLEKRIQKGIATEKEYYIWALKIRFLLSIKDTTLQFDMKDASKGPLIEKEMGLLGSEFCKSVFLNFDKPGFILKPNPFGSVFIFDNPIRDNDFGFADIPQPFWALVIALPSNKILAVLLTDRGMVKKYLLDKYKNKGGLKNFGKKIEANSTKEFVRLLTFKLLIHQYEIKNIPYGFTASEKEVTSLRVPDKPNLRTTFKKEVILYMASMLCYDQAAAEKFYNDFPITYKE